MFIVFYIVSIILHYINDSFISIYTIYFDIDNSKIPVKDINVSNIPEGPSGPQVPKHSYINNKDVYCLFSFIIGIGGFKGFRHLQKNYIPISIRTPTGKQISGYRIYGETPLHNIYEYGLGGASGLAIGSYIYNIVENKMSIIDAGKEGLDTLSSHLVDRLNNNTDSSIPDDSIKQNSNSVYNNNNDYKKHE
jgi:hypothetical protein